MTIADPDELSDDVEQVRDEVYRRALANKVVDCQEALEVLRTELEEGRFAPTNPEDEVYREHLISTLEHAELELERWCVDRDVMTPL